jgi:hypothetical protein
MQRSAHGKRNLLVVWRTQSPARIHHFFIGREEGNIRSAKEFKGMFEFY